MEPERRGIDLIQGTRGRRSPDSANGKSVYPITLTSESRQLVKVYPDVVLVARHLRRVWRREDDRTDDDRISVAGPPGTRLPADHDRITDLEMCVGCQSRVDRDVTDCCRLCGSLQHHTEAE
jgi:hypothetical protein